MVTQFTMFHHSLFTRMNFYSMLLTKCIVHSKNTRSRAYMAKYLGGNNCVFIQHDFYSRTIILLYAFYVCNYVCMQCIVYVHTWILSETKTNGIFAKWAEYVIKMKRDPPPRVRPSMMSDDLWQLRWLCDYYDGCYSTKWKLPLFECPNLGASGEMEGVP